MESVKNFWIGLDAQKKKWIVMGVGLALAVLLLSNFLFKEPIKTKDRIEATTVSLTGANEDRFGMDALERRIKKAEERNDQLEEEVQKASEAEAIRKEFSQMMEKQSKTIEQLERKLQAQEEANAVNGSGVSKEEMQAMLEAAQKDMEAKQRPQGGSSASTGSDQDETIWEDEDSFQVPEVNRRSGVSATENPEGSGQAKQDQGFRLITIESEADGSESQGDDSGADGQYLPAGTIISGVLVTGLDAPTNQESRAEPHPALLRIKAETLMPNFYTSDFSECFALVSGYGEMSSERAYLRSEVLSCIDDEGVAVEVPLKSFAVGEDGSAGVRGKLVNREGKLIAQSLLAGTLSAMSDAFGSTPVPQIVTSEQGVSPQPFQQNLSSDALQSAGAQGVGEALDRIADYYIDLADQIFPVLEIKSGRRIDLVLTSGIEIDFRQ